MLFSANSIPGRRRRYSACRLRLCVSLGQLIFYRHYLREKIGLFLRKCHALRFLSHITITGNLPSFLTPVGHRTQIIILARSFPSVCSTYQKVKRLPSQKRQQPYSSCKFMLCLQSRGIIPTRWWRRVSGRGHRGHGLPLLPRREFCPLRFSALYTGFLRLWLRLRLPNLPL